MEEVIGYLELCNHDRKYFICPFCYTKYNKKTGKPLKSALPKEHTILPEFINIYENGDIIVDPSICDKGRFPADKKAFKVRYYSESHYKFPIDPKYTLK